MSYWTHITFLKSLSALISLKGRFERRSVTLNPWLTLHTDTHTVCKWNAEARAKICFPTHKQTLACVHMVRYLNHPRPVQCYNGDRPSVLIYPRGNVKWLTHRPTYYPSQRGLRKPSRPVDHYHPFAQEVLWKEKKQKKRKGGGGESSETKPKAHLSVGWGGLDRAEIKSLWEHCDHNLRNPQPLQLSLTGPETPTSHTPALRRMWTRT